MTSCPVSPVSAPFPIRPDDPIGLAPHLTAALATGTPQTVSLATGETAVLVGRYEHCKEVLTSPHVTRDLSVPGAAQLLPGVRMLTRPMADGEAHLRWRAAVAGSFTARRVDELREQVTGIVDRALDDLQAAPSPADLMALVAFPVAIRTVGALLGLNQEDHQAFVHHGTVALDVDSTPEEKAEAFGCLQEVSVNLVHERRASPGDDLLSSLVHGSSGLSEEVLTATAMTLLVGGYENTAMQIGKTIYCLLRQPDVLDRVVRDPGLVPAAVEEALRHVGSVDSGFGSPRFSADGLQAAGVDLPPGTTLIVNRHAANHDAERFPHPEEFQIDRQARGAHLSFGHGTHYCLGAALARLELQTVVGRLLARFPGVACASPLGKVPWAFRITTSGPVALPLELRAQPSPADARGSAR